MAKKTSTYIDPEGPAAVYQSPIILSTTAIKKSHDTSLWVSKEKVVGYSFDSKSKNFILDDNLPLAENNNTRYSLQEFHIHEPAEHILNGKRYPLEIHFVFQDQVDGNILVLGHLAKFTKSKSSSIFTKILNDEAFVMPPMRSSYNYSGSLTTGVTNEPIEWIVSTRLLRISFKDLVALAPYSKGARPIQPREGRDIVLVKRG